MKRCLYSLLLTGLVMAGLAGRPLSAQAEGSVVRAVLFYSPTCPHCHQVISSDLPPLMEKHGSQLQIVGINTASPEGQTLYQAAIDRFQIPPERRGVPTLVVGDVVLVGSGEIPALFPGLVDEYLAGAGMDWPDIPGLAEVVAAAEQEASVSPTEQVLTATPGPSPVLSPTPAPEVTPTPALLPTIPADTATPLPAPTSTAGSTPAVAAVQATLPSQPEGGLILLEEQPVGLWAKVSRDPAGNTLAILVLMGMIAMVGYTGATFWSAGIRPAAAGWEGAIPLLCLVGFGVAGYLAYVETAQVAPVCGPVGDCSTVQQSEYARLFGLIPIGVFGLAGYVAIMAAWLVGRYGQGALANLAWLALFGMALAGTLFSIYLTFLEPFVIGATCAWCLTSAVIMTLLLWLSMTPARRAVADLKAR